MTPLGDKAASELKGLCSNSKFECFLFDNTTLIGVGRALTDELDCSYNCDVVTPSEYQRFRLGRNSINPLLESSFGHKKILLYAILVKEDFDKKLGFKPMNTATAIFSNEQQAIAARLLGSV